MQSRHGGRSVRMSATLPPLNLVILMPLRDDWVSASQLTCALDQALSSFRSPVQVILVDDGSLQPCPAGLFRAPYSTIRRITVLPLRRNLGHQRAIAIGLAHIHNSIPCDAVLVMDADGEDTPQGVLQLLHAWSGSAIFAERSRRTESAAFITFYRLFRVLHRVLTGISVRVGNFSILPAHCLQSLVVMSELWNHYAAAFFRSGLPFTTCPIPRGHRIAGRSRMNFVSLAAHGISAISVFSDIVAVRLLVAVVIGAFLGICGILAAAFLLFTDRAIPLWAAFSVAVLTILLTQLITVAASFAFTTLSNRISLGFVPLRDYQLFTGESYPIYPHE